MGQFQTGGRPAGWVNSKAAKVGYFYPGVDTPQARTLSVELTAVDAWLADERFFRPYQERFYTRIGRPTVPVETYLRLMYLKHRYGFGYETLTREVADSLHWRRFCCIPLDGAGAQSAA